jgi:hypothetical protein
MHVQTTTALGKDFFHRQPSWSGSAIATLRVTEDTAIRAHLSYQGRLTVVPMRSAGQSGLRGRTTATAEQVTSVQSPSTRRSMPRIGSRRNSSLEQLDFRANVAGPTDP